MRMPTLAYARIDQVYAIPDSIRNPFPPYTLDSDFRQNDIDKVSGSQDKVIQELKNE